MADDTTTTDVTEDGGSATDSGATDDVTAHLSDAGKKALTEERKARSAAERQAKAAQKQLDDLNARLREFEERDKSETQKLTDRLTEAEKTATSAQGRLLRYEVAADKKLPSEWAARLQGSTREELEADADALLEALGTTKAPSFDGGVRPGAPAPTDMNTLIRNAAGLG